MPSPFTVASVPAWMRSVVFAPPMPTHVASIPATFGSGFPMTHVPDTDVTVPPVATYPDQFRELPRTVEVGDGSTTFTVHLEYVRNGTALSFKVNSSPGGIVWVDGASRGRVPVTGLKLESRQTLLELRKPGEDTGLLLKLQYRPN